jgi:TetR/AcrR family transcriptional regulator, cholesterol catabolism regulator
LTQSAARVNLVMLLNKRLVNCGACRAAQPMTKHLERPSSALDRQTWREILTAAKDLFLDRGYRGVSMREIADAVQVTPAALYYHFPQGKEGLFTRMIQTVFVEEGMASLERALAAAPDLRERLTRLTAALLRLPLDERLWMLLRDAREHIKDPQSQRIILSLRDRIRQHVEGVFQAARETGEIRTDIPVTVLVGCYMGLLREAQSPPGGHSAPHLVGVLLDGIATPGGAHVPRS